MQPRTCLLDPGQNDRGRRGGIGQVIDHIGVNKQPSIAGNLLLARLETLEARSPQQGESRIADAVRRSTAILQHGPERLLEVAFATTGSRTGSGPDHHGRPHARIWMGEGEGTTAAHHGRTGD